MDFHGNSNSSSPSCPWPSLPARACLLLAWCIACVGSESEISAGQSSRVSFRYAFGLSTICTPHFLDNPSLFKFKPLLIKQSNVRNHGGRRVCQQTKSNRGRNVHLHPIIIGRATLPPCSLAIGAWHWACVSSGQTTDRSINPIPPSATNVIG